VFRFWFDELLLSRSAFSVFKKVFTFDPYQHIQTTKRFYDLEKQKIKLNQMKCSTFRLAKYGENLRTSFDRNVNRIKSTLPIRLPPDAGSVVEDRTKSGTQNRSGNRPLIGSFSGFQERLMNSFPSTLSSSHIQYFLQITGTF
jgi:hypothetical protein